MITLCVDRPPYYMWQKGVDRPLYYKIYGEGIANLKAQLDWQCFYNAKKGAMFSRDNIWTNVAKMGQEEWYKMYVRPFHRQLACRHSSSGAGNFASSCESIWSAYGHIHSEVSNRPAPATTEKPVSIYSNWNAVASIACDNALKIYWWDSEWCTA